MAVGRGRTPRAHIVVVVLVLVVFTEAVKDEPVRRVLVVVAVAERVRGGEQHRTAKRRRQRGDGVPPCDEEHPRRVAHPGTFPTCDDRARA